MLLLRDVLEKFHHAPGPMVPLTRLEFNALCGYYGALSTVPYETFMGKWIKIDDSLPPPDAFWNPPEAAELAFLPAPAPPEYPEEDENA